MRPSELRVEIFDWPSRFLVQCDEPDGDWKRFYHELEDLCPYAPYLVDLVELEAGWCGCRDFAVNVMPHLGAIYPHRTVCKHIIAAGDFLISTGGKRPIALTFK